MSEKTKAIHNAYCDYEIAKAKQPSRIYSVRSEVKRKSQGIKTYNMSKAMLAQQLASLFKGGKQMQTVTYTEMPNGARYLSTEGKQMDIMNVLTQK